MKSRNIILLEYGMYFAIVFVAVVLFVLDFVAYRDQFPHAPAWTWLFK
jgi:hypothetical protein